MSTDSTLLLIGGLTLVFSALTFFRPILGSLWRKWLRFWWYRAVVALRENRSYTWVDLPDGIKGAMLLVLHPARRWYRRPTVTEHRIRHFVECPFYRPKSCPYTERNDGPFGGCENASCYQLGSFSTDQENPYNEEARLRRLVRGRPSRHRLLSKWCGSWRWGGVGAAGWPVGPVGLGRAARRGRFRG